MPRVLVKLGIKVARNGENMIELIGFEESDMNEFTELAIQSFVEDKELYGDYPPLIDIEHRSLCLIHQGNTFKILKDGKMIGGTIIFSDNKGHYTLGAIFIHPSYQNQGIGEQVLHLVEDRYPDAKSWYLDTPYLSYRNHHFYEKMGYRKTGEEIPNKDSDFKLFLYEKVV